MFPNAVIETGGPGWFENEKSHREGICSRIARQQRGLTDGFPQADFPLLIQPRMSALEIYHSLRKS